MAGIYTTITALADKLGADDRLLTLLLQMERGVITAEGEKALEAWIGEAYLQALLLGYTNQIGLLDIAPSVGAVTASKALATQKAAQLAPTVLKALEKAPELINLTENLLTYGAAIEGHTRGQQVAAETHSLPLKRWVRYRTPKTGKRKHSSLEGLTIPRDELFTLPSGAKVYGPHDWERYPKVSEWINCGHGLIFLPSN